MSMTDKPKIKGRPTAVWYEHAGQRMSVADLAALAGCSRTVMFKRLATRCATDAVQMGGPDVNRAREHQRGIPTGQAMRHDYNGQMLTARELAQLAGCKPRTMWQRLKHMIAADAVAAGKSSQRAKAAPKPKMPRAVKPAAPIKPKAVAAQRPAKLPRKAKPQSVVAAPVVCNVLPVVCFSGRDLRHTFIGPPGRHVDSGSCRPWAQSYAGAA